MTSQAELGITQSLRRVLATTVLVDQEHRMSHAKRTIMATQVVDPTAFTQAQRAALATHVIEPLFKSQVQRRLLSTATPIFDWIA